MPIKRKIVSVIGPNQTRCNVDVYNFGLALGKALVEDGYTIVCGGMFGFMEAVSKGARMASNYQYGATVGILPGADRSDACDFVDIVIPTGMGWARNQLIINSADIVVSVAGGAGTLSELAYAWQAGKTVICYTPFDGWTKRLADTNLDTSKKGLFKPANTLEQILKYIKFGV